MNPPPLTSSAALTLDDLAMGVRLLRDVPALVRHPVRLEEARRTVSLRFARREADLLALIRCATAPARLPPARSSTSTPRGRDQANGRTREIARRTLARARATPSPLPGPTDPFPYARLPVPMSNHVEGATGGYVVRLLQFPSAGENGQEGNRVTTRYHERAEPGRRPLVVILPIWGGNAYPPAIVASDLLDQGSVNVMRVLGPDSLMDWAALAASPTPDALRETLRQMVERVHTAVVDVRRLLDWAEARPAVDSDRIGVIGFSESTLQVTGLMASDPRIAAVVLMMGGAHPHEILATCYGPPEGVRTAIQPRFGWTTEQFAGAMEPLMRPVDPARLVSRVEPDRVLIIDAGRDDCVPAGAREALWDVTGRPTRVTVRSTHSGAFFGMTFLGGNHLRHRITAFFEEALR